MDFLWEILFFYLVSRLLDDGDCVVDVPGGLAVDGHDLDSKIHSFIYFKNCVKLCVGRMPHLVVLPDAEAGGLACE